MLGLIQEKDGLAAQALDRLNVKYDAVVQAIRQVVAIDEDTDVSGHLSFTPRVKRVLENSLREAMPVSYTHLFSFPVWVQSEHKRLRAENPHFASHGQHAFGASLELF